MKAGASQTALPIHRTALPSGLYVVATPIGNLRDVTLRALEVLRSAERIACEDTRITRRLLAHYGITTPMEAYHDHNAARKRPQLLEFAQKAPLALVSDAGTPLISDPGYKLVREAIETGLRVEAVPGPSSVMAALCVAGLPTDRFLFAGFLPTRPAQIREVLERFKAVPATLVFFESAKRLGRSLALMAEVLGSREACVARELTKLHEEARRSTLDALAVHYQEVGEPRGEVVVVIGPPTEEAQVFDDEALDALLGRALAEYSLKDAVVRVCALTGLPRGRIYVRALELKGK